MSLVSTSPSAVLPQILNLSPAHYGRPMDILRNCRNDLELARLSNLRIRLLLHATPLSAHTSKFRSQDGRNRSPVCNFCSLGLPEDSFHLVSICPAMQPIQDMWLPKIYGLKSPPPPALLKDRTLGIVRLDDQASLLRFLADLFAYKTNLI